MSKVKMNAGFRQFVNEAGGQANVAKLLSMSPGHVSLLFHGKRTVTVALAERIEIATQGRISRESLVFPRRQAAAQSAN